MRIAWTPTARESLREIRAYIARGSPVYAQRTVDRIVGAVTRLRDHPYSGRVIPETNEQTLREVILGSYRICYRVDAIEW